MLTISVRESFDRNNPWVPLLTGFSNGAPRGLLLLLVFFLVIFPVGFTIAWWFGVFESTIALQNVATAAYIFGIMISFLAPSLGAQARRKLEASPFFPESQLTHLTDRDMLAAVHGRILLLTAIGFVIAATISFNLLSTFLFAERDALRGLNQGNLLCVFLRFIGYFQLHENGHGTPQIIAFFAIAPFCFAAGVYLHATILASICQIDSRASFRGGIVTAIILMAMALLAPLRYQLAQPAFAWIFWIELLILIARVFIAQFVWRMILKTQLNPTRRVLFGA